MSDPIPRLRDAYPGNDSFNAMELATADRRFEQLIERRERLIERSRFGVLALNGASTVGLISSYQGVKSAGFEPSSALVFFAVGMILALLSIFFETLFVGARAAHMFGHLSSLRSIRATLDDRLTERGEKILAEQLQAMGERAERESITKIELDDAKDGLPNDFAYSPLALVTLHSAAGAWIGGVLAMLLALLT